MNKCPISGLSLNDSASTDWSSPQPSASLGCPPSTSSDTASPKTGPSPSRRRWMPSRTFHAHSQLYPYRSSSAWWTFTTASSLRLPNSCVPFMKLWKTKPRDKLWTGPRREIRPLGRRRMLWLTQQCWRTQHPMLPSPSPQMLQTMQWAQYMSSGWTAPGNGSLSSASSWAQTNRNTALFTAISWTLPCHPTLSFPAGGTAVHSTFTMKVSLWTLGNCDHISHYFHQTINGIMEKIVSRIIHHENNH